MVALLTEFGLSIFPIWVAGENTSPFVGHATFTSISLVKTSGIFSGSSPNDLPVREVEIGKPRICFLSEQQEGFLVTKLSSGNKKKICNQ